MKAINRIKSFLVGEDNNFEKYQQAGELLPKGNTRLIAPFIGAGSIFLNTDYPSYLLADSNQDLINVFETLASQKQAFIERARQYFLPVTNTKESYDYYQHVFNETSFNREISASRIRRACIFLYLNHHGAREQCLCHGIAGIDVPYGNNEVLFPEQEMQDFIAKVNRCCVTFLVANFKDTLTLAGVGDVVYCDLPYIGVDKNDYFRGGKLVFSWGDHFRLLNIFCDLESKGIPIVFSNNSLEHKALVEKFVTTKD